jgi:hypothetical protein
MEVVKMFKKNKINFTNYFYFKSFDFLIRFLSLTLLSGITVLIGHPIYGTTDDSILAGFVDGSYTGEREKNLIFIRPIIGCILNPIQNIFPSYGVYAIFLLLILITSFSIFGTVVNGRIHQKHTALSSEVLWIIISSTITVWFTLNPTYTAVSIIATGMTFMVIMRIILFDEFKNYKTILFFATLILCLSAFIRPEGAIGAITLSIFPLVYSFITKKKFEYKKILLVFITIIFFFGFDRVVSSNIQDSAWKEYDKWNSMRHQIQHRTAEDYLLDLRTQNNWTIPEYHLFMNLAFGDKTKFNSDWLNPAFESTEFTRGVRGVYNSSPALTFVKLFDLFMNYAFILIAQIVIMLFIFFEKKKVNINISWQIATSWLPILLSLYFTVATLHTPERSIYPILLLPSIFFLAQLEKSETRIRNNWSIAILTIVAFILITVSQESFIFKNKQNIDRIKKSQISLVEMSNYDAKSIFIGPGNSELNFTRNPYFEAAYPSSPQIITTGNWDTFSPHWVKRLKYYGIESQSIYEALFQNQIYWYSNVIPDSPYLVELYLKDNGYPKANRENIDTFNNEQVVYKYLPQ